MPPNGGTGRHYTNSFKYVRHLVLESVLMIPPGYKVSGLDKLEKSVDNAAGAFISKATVGEIR